MKTENPVIFKGKKDGILVILDDKSDFESCKTALAKKVIEAKHFFSGSNTAVSFTGKKLTQAEEIELIQIFNSNADTNISFIFEQKKEKGNLLDTWMKKSNLSKDGSLTKVYKGSVRSGQLLEYPGTIIVIGDVNPGGYIHAKDNIIVLGVLKGQVHAGLEGNKEAFVAALSMQPTQLRIAHIITRFPENLQSKVPEYAYVSEENIAIAPLL